MDHERGHQSRGGRRTALRSKSTSSPGGELVYDMTARAPEQIQFMQRAGMPLTTESRKTFTELVRPTRIAYTSLADFIPDMDPYEFLTVVDLKPRVDGVRVVMTVDTMHDDEWTQRGRHGP